MTDDRRLRGATDDQKRRATIALWDLFQTTLSSPEFDGRNA